MTAALAAPTASADQRVFLRGLSWAQYGQMLDIRGESAGPRLMFSGGNLEIMSPSRSHEAFKTTLARLIEAWADATETPLTGAGSWTVRRPDTSRGAEADLCYVVREVRQSEALPEHPDIVLEVVWTQGGLDKLDLWWGLGVTEVWIWEEGGLTAWCREGESWVSRPRSQLLPDLDLPLIARLAAAESQVAAVRTLRSMLRTS